jgi:23S rRNA (adenine2030-N6)-methyltransferase
MGHYDHRVHAGNAGDVWKHFLLLEAANCLLDPDSSLVYAESHVGHPHYALKASGDWEGGIGQLWPFLPSLSNFCYFQILAELNTESPSPDRKGLLYPGSARFIYELARRKGAGLKAEIWDTDPDVSASWQEFKSAAAASGLHHTAKPVFHQADGFFGVLSWLRRFSSGDLLPKLLLIDPPYIDPDDMLLAEELLLEAKERGWIVLWWYMPDMKTAPEDLAAFELHFSQAGLDGGRWKGAAVAFAGPDCDAFERLLGQMHRQINDFIQILKSINLKR